MADGLLSVAWDRSVIAKLKRSTVRVAGIALAAALAISLWLLVVDMDAAPHAPFKLRDAAARQTAYPGRLPASLAW